MGQLTSSKADEVNQPIWAPVNNANAASCLQRAELPYLALAFRAPDDMIKDRSGEQVIDRIRALVEKQPTRTDVLDINEVIM